MVVNQELSWDEVVHHVRLKLNEKRGVWSQISEDLAKVENQSPPTIYRWLRDFSDASYLKVDGGRLARLAQVLQIPVRFMIPLPRKGGSGLRIAPLRARRVRARG